ncbi:Molybdopterin oxidoreductase family protein [gamma proteobacterium HdN1]|nr:Molybdopterin oxidoreductase family protein [gamma proteobacterium HdN1]
MTTHATACILCSRNCGLLIDVDENGQFNKIRGDANHPVSQGYICQKAARLGHYQHHADRLGYPLRREPDGSFVQISWEQALTEIAERLVRIRDQHGGQAFATAGGGGQGNHLGGAYSEQLRSAMQSRKSFGVTGLSPAIGSAIGLQTQSRNNYNSLGQEKTGDFWVNGRLFGRQSCHTTEDIEHSDYILLIGCNPFQAHGIPNARDTLKEIQKDKQRTLVLIDPRATETARYADIHLQLKPGTDAFLMAAMLAIILRENLHDQDFLARHCTGFEIIEPILRAIPVEDYVARADVPLALVEKVARDFATARTACVRVDLGTQHTPNTTLNAWLEKLLYLITGNFGIKGGNNLHSTLLPVLGHTDERKPHVRRTAHTGMFPIAGVLPPAILPAEILNDGENRIRAVLVDSSNPLVSWPDTAAFEKAFKALELLVVVDVTMTETARLAHYVLPAASQFEKWECTGFNLDFPRNGFHLRHPIAPRYAESLPEPEIYTRLLEKMGVIPTGFPWLSRIARYEPEASGQLAMLGAALGWLGLNKKYRPFSASILYRIAEAGMPDGSAAAASLLALATLFANEHPEAVRRAGHKGNRLTLGANLFRAIMRERSGVIFSEHLQEDVWSLVKTHDKRIHLHIPEMVEALNELPNQPEATCDEYPLILAGGERRSYNANQIYRNPAWRKVDPHGALRIHPNDASALGLNNGQSAACASRHGEIPVVIELDEAMRPGMVSLPHGYGMRYQDSAPIGPEINRLTSVADCEPFTWTPYHKHVAVRVGG